MLNIKQATEYSESLLTDINGLIAQLSSSAQPLTQNELAEILQSDAISLLLASDREQVVGMLTLACFPIPTGMRAWIEDVVVSEAARGNGVGSALVEAAVKIARARGARTLDLTSRPSREAANRLYQRLGFKPRQTNVYRMELN
jgi:ribosomal protein S18 acetylase RimI-like enzyme